MESYEEFIQRHYNTHNDDDEDEDDPQTPVTPSSVIVFHGARVLPPLLNEQQRDEMRRLRETAVSLMKRRREEESHISFTDVRISDAARHTDKSDDITDCDITSSAPLTSTAHDGRSTNQLRASPEDDSLENTQITVLFEKHKTHRPQDAPDNRSHNQTLMTTMMMSSGYVTNDNTDVTGHSGWMEGGDIRLDTTRSGSDIISHVPVDGAVLEEEIIAPAEDVVESVNPPSDSDEGPYRMSLQNLIKKSQEYRRRQRLLRNQARAAEEHNLSDKENEELPKQMWRTELRKAREQRKEKEGEDHINTDVTNALPQSVSAELPVTARSLYDSKQKRLGVSRSPSAVRFTNIPTPKFCLSPVRCKKRSRIPGPDGKALDKPAQIDPIGPSDRRDNVMMISSQTEQIAQLELNLFSLKSLISDLESTLTLSQTGEVDPKRPSGVTFSETVTAKDCGVGEENASSHSPDEAGSSVIGWSYDVDVPSGLWKQLTPEMGGHEVTPRVKRRLLMNEDEAFSPGRETGSTLSSTPRVMSSGLSAQTQEDQVTALMEEECRQQQELLQSLAERYQFLRSVSFPCPGAGSRLEDTLTSITASSVCTHAELTDTHSTSRQSCLPLLAAVARGFLTRRLLRTERVSRLIRTITDTQMFLVTLQLQPAVSSKHELMLQERVTLQLRAARCELHQIFFSMSSCDQMQMIRCDRELSRDRRLKTHDNKVKGSLSAATRKALERKKLMLQRKSADRKKFSPSNEEKWNLVPKICRVSKKMTALRGAR
ncbi:centriolar coiled-coil protein of 110 kDa isoform X1 [Onychostoma macrolepis]|uniref:centriolar coiled-coil protein of 110 kDa isoform X1 n=1 Tax=Onychostoma macrolepis TaxID=369639 RepID=UPI00272BE664|nr:centriolar coiled-coil protein of 110 kDa isoform X1 [Onychostoma macrolepis]XP_058647159.1 centriolar coiled-coil protein of 110 kDa isoform X1 [Onychostoma macrolepis]